MQPDLFGAQPAPKPGVDKEYLGRQLIKLGDMLGDGMGDEPGGAWIKTEYRKICKALGYVMPTKPRRNNSQVINAAVAKYVETNRCECGGVLIQSRPGSMRVECVACRKRYQLKGRKASKQKA